jgi:hypothetical protein
VILEEKCNKAVFVHQVGSLWLNNPSFSCYHTDAIPGSPELKVTLWDSFDLCLEFE